jgi:ketosteroid isomerase-like protein
VAAISRKETQMTSAESFDQAIEANHHALDQIASGDPSGFFELYSDSEEATLANPFGPPARGRAQIEEAVQRAASNYREGRVVEFVSFAKVETDEFGYTLDIERFEAKVGGSDEVTPVALRVTCIFRAEDGMWKLVHRHADPITTIQPAESVVGS